ncbi:MAG: CAP domain-containing protein [Acidobacteria bacterium]|nr:CAP domain-containing protein [Acidobacteriota bacterium]
MKTHSHFFARQCWRTFLLILLALPAAGQNRLADAAPLQPPRIVTAAEISRLEMEVFDEINSQRSIYGLNPLVWNEQAARVARLHSTSMADFDFFSHAGLDGRHVDNRADRIGLRNWRVIGENIAYNSGYSDPAERAVIGWMNSDGHRRNILRDNWSETGIGIAVSTAGKFYFTQVFLQRK